jgi:hypothetical protein
MLQYIAVGPDSKGNFYSAYLNPGQTSLTINRICYSLESAQDDADHMNLIQHRREAAIKRERDLCGLHGVYPALGM